jgi:hypothetical protein
MSTVHKIPVLLFYVLGLFACSTIPKDAPAYSAAQFIDKPGYATVCLYHSATNAEQPAILLDGHPVYQVRSGTYTLIHVEEGSHQFKMDFNLLAYQDDAALDFLVTAGKRYFYAFKDSTAQVISYDFRPASMLKSVQNAAAEQELMRCCRYVAPLNQQYE